MLTRLFINLSLLACITYLKMTIKGMLMGGLIETLSLLWTIDKI